MAEGTKLSDLYFDVKLNDAKLVTQLKEVEETVREHPLKIEFSASSLKQLDALKNVATNARQASSTIIDMGDSMKSVVEQIRSSEANLASAMRSVAQATATGFLTAHDNAQLLIQAIKQIGITGEKSKGQVGSIAEELNKLKARRKELMQQKDSLGDSAVLNELNEVERKIAKITAEMKEMGRAKGRQQFKGTAIGQELEQLKEQERHQNSLNRLKEQGAILQQRINALRGRSLSSDYAGERAALEMQNAEYRKQIQYLENLKNLRTRNRTLQAELVGLQGAGGTVRNYIGRLERENAILEQRKQVAIQLAQLADADLQREQRNLVLAKARQDAETKIALTRQQNRDWDTTGKRLAKEQQALRLKQERFELDNRILAIQMQLDWMQNGNGKATIKEQERLRVVQKIAEMEARIAILQSSEGGQLASLTKKYNELWRQMTGVARTSNQAANGLGRAAQAQQRLARTTIMTNTAIKEQSVILSQLSAYLGMYFSVYGAVHFLQSLVRVSGELERQLVTLKAITQDSEKATEIFGQIRGLALESPFTAFDLIKSAKQLSAYQIPTDDLFDTTRRLSDLSAGLGVDINRLILAYGQVYTASVLRGQELRQFTEAGLPLVSALADKFTELEGKVVTSGQVFDYISKRKVPFEMVKDVLFELTDVGGKFYEMQQKQAQSLAGKVQVLHDAWQMLLYDIGNSNSTGLKNIVDALNAFVRSLQSLLPIIKGFTIAYLAPKIGTRLAYGSKGNTLIQQLSKEANERRAHLSDEKRLRKLTQDESALLRAYNGDSRLAQRQIVFSTREKLAKLEAAAATRTLTAAEEEHRVQLQQTLAVEQQRLSQINRAYQGGFKGRFTRFMQGLSRTQIPFQTLSPMIQEGQVSARDLKRMYFGGKIDASTFKQAGAQINMLPSAINSATRIERFPKLLQGVARGFSMAYMAVGNFGRALVALAANPYTWILALVGTLVSAASHASQAAESINNFANSVSEKAKQAADSLEKLRRGMSMLANMAKNGLTPQEVTQDTLDRYVERFKEATGADLLADNYLRGVGVRDLASQVALNSEEKNYNIILRERIKLIEEAAEAYEHMANVMSTGAGVSLDKGGWFRDNTLENVAEGLSDIAEIQERVMKNAKEMGIDFSGISKKNLLLMDSIRTNISESEEGFKDIQRMIQRQQSFAKNDLERNAVVDYVMRDIMQSDEFSKLGQTEKLMFRARMDEFRPELHQYQERASIVFEEVAKYYDDMLNDMKMHGENFTDETWLKLERENPQRFKEMMGEIARILQTTVADAQTFLNLNPLLFNVNIRFNTWGNDDANKILPPYLAVAWDKLNSEQQKVFGGSKAAFENYFNQPTSSVEFASSAYSRLSSLEKQIRQDAAIGLDTKDLEAQAKAVRDVIAGVHLIDPNAGKKTGRKSGGRKEDTWLKETRKRFELLREAIRKYEEIMPRIGHENAVERIMEAFDLTEDEKKYLKRDGLLDAVTDYYKKAEEAAKKGSSERKAFLETLRKQKGDTEIGIFINSLDRDLETFNRRMDLMERAFNRYEKLFEAAGNYALARRLSGIDVDYGLFGDIDENGAYIIGRNNNRFKYENFIKSVFKEQFGLTLEDYMSPKYLSLGVEDLVRQLEGEGIDDAKQVADALRKYLDIIMDMEYDVLQGVYDRRRDLFVGQRRIDLLAAQSDDLAAKVREVFDKETQKLQQGKLNEIIARGSYTDINGVEVLLEKVMGLDEVKTDGVVDSEKLRNFILNTLPAKEIRDLMAQRAEETNTAVDEVYQSVFEKILQARSEFEENMRSMKPINEAIENTFSAGQSEKWINKLETAVDNAVPQTDKNGNVMRDAYGNIMGYTITVDGKNIDLTSDHLDDLIGNIDKLRGRLAGQNPFKALADHFKKVREQTKLNTATGKKEEKTEADRNKELAETYELAAACIHVFADATNGVKEFFNAIGSEDGAAAMEVMGNIFSSTEGILKAYKEGGWLGASVAGIGAIGSILGSIFDANDKRILKLIEKLEIARKKVDNLTSDIQRSRNRTLGEMRVSNKELNKWTSNLNSTLDVTGGNIIDEIKQQVQRNIERVFGFVNNPFLGKFNSTLTKRFDLDWLSKYSESARSYAMEWADLMAQRELVNAELIAEEERKSSKRDKSKIEDYKNQLAELDDKIKYYVQDWAKEVYSIDLKGWAEQFGSAIVNAFANGESAARAFRNTVGDVMKSIVEKWITLQLIEPALQRLEDFLFNANNGVLNDFELTPEEIGAMAPYLKNLEGSISKGKEVFDIVNGILKQYGFSMKSSESGSSLSAGIQNITEDTADLLASYLNAIRAAVEYIRYSHEQRDAEGNVMAEGQLQQLRMIQANTLRNADAAEAIQTALNSVIYTSANGKRLRV